MEVTRKGYYTIICPDGLPLTKPDGSIRQVTTRDECYEYITDDAKEYDDEEGTYTISCPDRDVLRTDLSTHQIIPADDFPPRVISTPSVSFDEGTADEYEMSGHIQDDGKSQLTYTLYTVLYTGTHTQPDNLSALIDESKLWVEDELIGYTLHNLTDGSEGVIIDNLTLAISCGINPDSGMTGGAENDWDTGDAYQIVRLVPATPDANGFSLNATTGLLSYDGVGGASNDSYILRCTDAVGRDESSAFSITVVALDIAPTISTIPNITFTQGTGQQQDVDLTQYVTDDGVSPVTYGFTGLTTPGVYFTEATGILTYDGFGQIDSSTGHTLTATDAVDSATSSSFSITITDTSAVEADFVARATDSSNVLYATNFDDVYLAGALDSGRSGISSTAEMDIEAFDSPGEDNFTWDTGQKRSGAGALRLYREAGSRAWSSLGFKLNGDKDGISSTGTVYNRFYCQVSVRCSRADIGWRSDDPGSPKVLKFHPTFTNGEFVLTNWRYSGFIGSLLNGTDAGIRTVNPTGGYSTGDVQFGQVSIAPTATLDGLSVQDAAEAAGPLREVSGGQFLEQNYGYSSGNEYLDERTEIINNGGFPNSWALTSGAVAWEPDEWITVTVFLDAVADRVMVWGGKPGEAPVLFSDSDDMQNTLKATPSEQYRYVQLVNQSTNEVNANQPLRERWYDELICSTDPIKHPNPGGTPFTLPGNLDGTALFDLAGTLTSGQNTNYTDGQLGTVLSASVDGTIQFLAWASRFFHWPADNKFDVLLKDAQGQTNTWRHIQFDEVTEAWTDYTNVTSGPGTWTDTGHQYDNSTMNPDNGDLFIVTGNNRIVRKWTRSTATWSVINGGGMPTGAMADGVAYHPNLYGTGDGALLVATSFTIRAWRESTDSWETLISGLSSSQEGCGVYIANGDYAIMRGDDGDNLYRVNNDRSVTNLGTPPIRTTGGSYQASTHGSIHAHPDASSKIILIEHDTSGGPSNRYWESSDQGDNWGSPSTHGLHAGGLNDNAYGGVYLSIPDYNGVMWCVSQANARIWKP